MITVVTVYCEGNCEYNVTAIEGRLSEEQRRTIANNHALQPDDRVGFVEVETPTLEKFNPKPWSTNGILARIGRKLVGDAVR